MRDAAPRLHAIAAAIFAATLGVAAGSERADAGEAKSGLLDLSARRLGGAEEPLSRYRGEVLLVVNTASECGYTPQYAGLQTLYERYRSDKFSVLGFPSNDFDEQEPGDDRQIARFCRANYGVEFPMFSKVRVLGAQAHPVYAYLTTLPAPIGGPVEWNFQKYLVDRSGAVVARFESETEPEDPKLVAALERLLAEPYAAANPKSADAAKAESTREKKPEPKAAE